VTRKDVFWAAVGVPGFEHLALEVSPSGISADGLVLRQHDGRALRLRYTMHLDPEWRPVELAMESLTDASRLHLRSDGNGRWLDDLGAGRSHVRGCIDVDIMATPFTNTPAIKRLGLGPGQSREIRALFVRIPDLGIQVHRQRYTCLEATATGARYRYENLESGFWADLDLDAEGLVNAYSGVWQRA